MKSGEAGLLDGVDDGNWEEDDQEPGVYASEEGEGECLGGR